MGQITAFNLGEILKITNCSMYVETGTGIGESLNYAKSFPFKKLYTVDIDKDLLEAVKNKNNDDRIVYINDNSSNAFKTLIPTLEAETSVCFFLDAHLPGADFHKISYEESMKQYKMDCFPLEEELKTIKKCRTNKKDVIIIDDLQFYEPTQCEHKTWFYGDLQEKLGLKQTSNFIYEMYSDTHDISVYTKHQGYLLLMPK